MGWKSFLKKAANVSTLGAVSGLEKVGKSLGSSGMAGSLIGGGLGFAVGGPVGGLLGASIGGQFDTNRANAKAVADANEWNYQLWREQMAYNTPANQVARLRAAGLNPNLFYSQGDPGNASSSPTMRPAEYDYNYAKAIDKLAVYYQLQNLQAQNENLRAQTGNIAAQTAATKARGDLDRATLGFYLKYGYFPNQGNASAVKQFFADVWSKASEIGHSSDADYIGEIMEAGMRRVAYERKLRVSPYDMSKAEIYRRLDKGYIYDRNLGRWVKGKDAWVPDFK